MVADTLISTPLTADDVLRQWVPRRPPPLLSRAAIEATSVDDSPELLGCRWRPKPPPADRLLGHGERSGPAPSEVEPPSLGSTREPSPMGSPVTSVSVSLSSSLSAERPQHPSRIGLSASLPVSDASASLEPVRSVMVCSARPCQGVGPCPSNGDRAGRPGSDSRGGLGKVLPSGALAVTSSGSTVGIPACGASTAGGMVAAVAGFPDSGDAPSVGGAGCPQPAGMDSLSVHASRSPLTDSVEATAFPAARDHRIASFHDSSAMETASAPPPAVATPGAVSHVAVAAAAALAVADRAGEAATNSRHDLQVPLVPESSTWPQSQAARALAALVERLSKAADEDDRRVGGRRPPAEEGIAQSRPPPGDRSNSTEEPAIANITLQATGHSFKSGDSAQLLSANMQMATPAAAAALVGEVPQLFCRGAGESTCCSSFCTGFAASTDVSVPSSGVPSKRAQHAAGTIDLGVPSMFGSRHLFHEPFPTASAPSSVVDEPARCSSTTHCCAVRPMPAPGRAPNTANWSLCTNRKEFASPTGAGEDCSMHGIGFFTHPQSRGELDLGADEGPPYVLPTPRTCAKDSDKLVDSENTAERTDACLAAAEDGHPSLKNKNADSLDHCMLISEPSHPLCSGADACTRRASSLSPTGLLDTANVLPSQEDRPSSPSHPSSIAAAQTVAEAKHCCQWNPSQLQGESVAGQLLVVGDRVSPSLAASPPDSMQPSCGNEHCRSPTSGGDREVLSCGTPHRLVRSNMAIEGDLLAGTATSPVHFRDVTLGSPSANADAGTCVPRGGAHSPGSKRPCGSPKYTLRGMFGGPSVLIAGGPNASRSTGGCENEVPIHSGPTGSCDASDFALPVPSDPCPIGGSMDAGTSIAHQQLVRESKAAVARPEVVLPYLHPGGDGRAPLIDTIFPELGPRPEGLRQWCALLEAPGAPCKNIDRLASDPMAEAQCKEHRIEAPPRHGSPKPHSAASMPTAAASQIRALQEESAMTSHTTTVAAIPTIVPSLSGGTAVSDTVSGCAGGNMGVTKVVNVADDSAGQSSSRCCGEDCTDPASILAQRTSTGNDRGTPASSSAARSSSLGCTRSSQIVAMSSEPARCESGAIGKASEGSCQGVGRDLVREASRCAASAMPFTALAHAGEGHHGDVGDMPWQRGSLSCASTAPPYKQDPPLLGPSVSEGSLLEDHSRFQGRGELLSDRAAHGFLTRAASVPASAFSSNSKSATPLRSALRSSSGSRPRTGPLMTRVVAPWEECCSVFSDGKSNCSTMSSAGLGSSICSIATTDAGTTLTSTPVRTSFNTEVSLDSHALNLELPMCVPDKPFHQNIDDTAVAAAEAATAALSAATALTAATEAACSLSPPAIRCTAPPATASGSTSCRGRRMLPGMVDPVGLLAEDVVDLTAVQQDVPAASSRLSLERSLSPTRKVTPPRSSPPRSARRSASPLRQDDVPGAPVRPPGTPRRRPGAWRAQRRKVDDHNAAERRSRPWSGGFRAAYATAAAAAVAEAGWSHLSPPRRSPGLRGRRHMGRSAQAAPLELDDAFDDEARCDRSYISSARMSLPAERRAALPVSTGPLRSAELGCIRGLSTQYSCRSETWWSRASCANGRLQGSCGTTRLGSQRPATPPPEGDAPAGAVGPRFLGRGAVRGTQQILPCGCPPSAGCMHWPSGRPSQAGGLPPCPGESPGKSASAGLSLPAPDAAGRLRLLRGNSAGPGSSAV